MKASKAAARIAVPLVSTPIRAGFPNPAEDAATTALNLHDIVVKHPASTFYMRVEGDSMEGLGILSGDLVVVDKSLEPRSGDIVVAAVDGEFTLKTLVRDGEQGRLEAANAAYAPISVTADNDFQIWGVVTHTLHTHRS